jgi:Ni,Fe-hydrogenase III large subunit
MDKEYRLFSTDCTGYERFEGTFNSIIYAMEYAKNMLRRWSVRNVTLIDWETKEVVFNENKMAEVEA